MNTTRANFQIIKEMVDNDDYKLFEPYLRYIRFPLYKRVAKDARIDFTFPITVLVGPNGCNKSSILQALFGCPYMKNVGNYWFSTNVDKIDDSTRHCFIHGYKHEPSSSVVEVLKTRISKKTNPDYCEPSRPLLKYRMPPMPIIEKNEKLIGRSESRWDPIKKGVLYLDFRQSLPAFDKFFYHSSFGSTNGKKTKQDYIRQRSKPLSVVIQKRLSDFTYHGVKRVSDNRTLSQDKCQAINDILEKNYMSIQIVEHALYSDQFAKTVVITDPSLHYSEAFAGSGETSIVLLVDELLDADKASLILLDEPETSLHPRAQERLMCFLSEQVKQKKHQVVIATHSPSFVVGLPMHAIKTMHESSEGIMITSSSLPEEAFNAIGVVNTERKHIFVEDRLAKHLVEKYLELHHSDLITSIAIQIIPGGAEAIMSQYVYPYSQTNVTNALFLFDGDKNYKNRAARNPLARQKLFTYMTDGLIDISHIPRSDYAHLDAVIEELTGTTKIKFIGNGGNDSNGKLSEEVTEQKKKFIDFWGKYVRFLSRNTPEESILVDLPDEYKKELRVNTDDKDIDWKSIFVEYAKHDLRCSTVDAEEVFLTQKRFVARLPLDAALYEEIGKHISEFMQG